MMKMDVYDDDDDAALCFPAKRKNSTATIFDDHDDDEILCFQAKRKVTVKIVYDNDDDDDDVDLCFPAKRNKSTARISDDDVVILCLPANWKVTAAIVHHNDGDDVDLCFPAKRKWSSSTANDAKRRECENKYSEEEIEAWFNAYEITYGGEVCIDYSRDESQEELPIKHNGDFFKEELDISGAAFVEVDGRKSEKIHKQLLHLVRFASRCRQKCYLQKFSFPGEPGSEGSLSATSYMLFREDHDVAVRALKEYQKVKQNAKLKLREIMKVNSQGTGSRTFYITFSAEDGMTGEISTYQAALFNSCDLDVLGLLRNVDDDKVLAILSVKGTEEDLTALAADEDEFWRMWEERLAEGSDRK